MTEIRPNHPPAPTPPRFDDEIDLVDLTLAIWRRKWLVVMIFVLGIVLGGILAAMQTEQRHISAVLAVGKAATDEGGDRELVEQTSTVANWLDTTFLPAAAREQEREFSLDPMVLEFSVKSGDADSVAITATGRPEHVAAYTAAIESAARDVASQADSPVRGLETRLRSEIGKLELELEQLKDEDRTENERLSLQRELREKQNELESLEDQHSELNEQLERLATMISLEEGRAENINAYINEHMSRDAALLAKDASDAMTGMLLGNQLQNYMDRLAQINERITVELPRKIAEAQNELAEVERRKEVVATEVEQARLALKTFQTDHEREVKKLKLSISDKKASLEGIQHTGLLTEPQVIEESGTSSALFVALGAILGLFAGLFAALMANFISAARERLHESEFTEG